MINSCELPPCQLSYSRLEDGRCDTLSIEPGFLRGLLLSPEFAFSPAHCEVPRYDAGWRGGLGYMLVFEYGLDD